MDLTAWTMEKGFCFLLILFRVAGMMMTTPVLSNRAIPEKVRVAISLFLSVGLFAVVPLPDRALPTTTLETALLVAREVAIGVVTGFVALLVIASVQIAGQYIGVKMGFGIANMIDPATQSSVSEVATFYTLLAALLFLSLNGHHIVIDALAASFGVLPVGALNFPATIGMRLSAVMVVAFQVAFKMAAPIFIAVMLTNLVSGIIAKSAPQMNVFFSVGFIVTILGGIVLVGASLPVFRFLLTEFVRDIDVITVRVLQAS